MNHYILDAQNTEAARVLLQNTFANCRSLGWKQDSRGFVLEALISPILNLFEHANPELVLDEKELERVLTLINAFVNQAIPNDVPQQKLQRELTMSGKAINHLLLNHRLAH